MPPLPSRDWSCACHLLKRWCRRGHIFFISRSLFVVQKLELLHQTMSLATLSVKATMSLAALSAKALSLATFAKNIIMVAGDGDVPTHRIHANHATITNLISNLTSRAVSAILGYCQLIWQQQRHHLRRRCRLKPPPPLRLTSQTKSATEVDSTTSSRVPCQAQRQWYQQQHRQPHGMDPPLVVWPSLAQSVATVAAGRPAMPLGQAAVTATPSRRVMVVFVLRTDAVDESLMQDTMAEEEKARVTAIHSASPSRQVTAPATPSKKFMVVSRLCPDTVDESWRRETTAEEERVTHFGRQQPQEPPFQASSQGQIMPTAAFQQPGNIQPARLTYPDQSRSQMASAAAPAFYPILVSLLRGLQTSQSQTVQPLPSQTGKWPSQHSSPTEAHSTTCLDVDSGSGLTNPSHGDDRNVGHQNDKPLAKPPLAARTTCMAGLPMQFQERPLCKIIRVTVATDDILHIYQVSPIGPDSTTGLDRNSGRGFSNLAKGVGRNVGKSNDKPYSLEPPTVKARSPTQFQARHLYRDKSNVMLWPRNSKPMPTKTHTSVAATEVTTSTKSRQTNNQAQSQTDDQAQSLLHLHHTFRDKRNVILWPPHSKPTITKTHTSVTVKEAMTSTKPNLSHGHGGNVGQQNDKPLATKPAKTITSMEAINDCQK